MIKLKFLPHLPLRTWFALWGIAMIVLLGNWIGSRVFDWWDYSEDVGRACVIVFLLLMVTPLERRQSDDDS